MIKTFILSGSLVAFGSLEALGMSLVLAMFSSACGHIVGELVAAICKREAWAQRISLTLSMLAALPIGPLLALVVMVRGLYSLTY